MPRLVFSLAAALTLATAAHAQPVQRTQPAAPTFQVLRMVATPEERPQVQGVQVVVADLASAGARIERRGHRTGLVRVASYAPSAAWRFDPFWLIVGSGKQVCCIGLGRTERRHATTR